MPEHHIQKLENMVVRSQLLGQDSRVPGVGQPLGPRGGTAEAPEAGLFGSEMETPPHWGRGTSGF